MSVCWKPGWCECDDCGVLEEHRRCRLCGEAVPLSRWRRSKPGVLVDAEGNEVGLLAIVEWHDDCKPKEGS